MSSFLASAISATFGDWPRTRPLAISAHSHANASARLRGCAGITLEVPTEAITARLAKHLQHTAVHAKVSRSRPIGTKKYFLSTLSPNDTAPATIEGDRGGLLCERN